MVQDFPPVAEMVLGHAPWKSEEVGGQDEECWAAKQSSLSDSTKLPEWEGGLRRLTPRVSKFRGFYELFHRTILNSQGVLLCPSVLWSCVYLPIRLMYMN